ncbi:dTDP-glucose 4,6-dehydratase [Actinomadura rubrobrunea]|uniref:dTDP-glucose 4,6-dehydratase n=1 Tax=Actinomadura rubrobrunea TaxID=115335 RepID=A0A9W6PVQ7_9ACTN|nr:dTDP-glucose 4,6-dehydratase [Actinomadura rubrobrunea]GLW63954.1 dTDP-glucose 4,6-dehydratase [Actinomadura rubrobrunea]
MAPTIAVTGAAGFIGSNFVRYWRSAHPEQAIVAVDALTYAGNVRNLDEVRAEIVFEQADIADEEAMTRILRGHRVDTVVNFAAETHNSLAVLEPARFFRTNVLGTQALLEACRRAGVSRFHQVSTCEVYGDLALDSPESFTESSPYRPRTPYSASKAGGDHVVRCYHTTFGLPVTISNCANNYGPYQFPEKVLPLFITNALAGLPLPLYASTGNRREWISVIDHCRAIDLILTRGEIGETYHVGTGEEATIEEIADLVLDELGLPATLKTLVPDRPGHDRRYLLDTGKLRRTLGWAPQVSFEQGVRETIRWYRNNRAWWEPLLAHRRIAEESWQGGQEPTGALAG